MNIAGDPCMTPQRGGKENENPLPHAPKEEALLSALFVLAVTSTTNPDRSGTNFGNN
jgi:hypothetical protein